MSHRIALGICLGCLLAGCRGPEAKPVRIYAAISTQEPLEEILRQYQSVTGVSIEPNFGASSSLARQIEQGGSTDLFLSADEAWADYLDNKGLLTDRKVLLSNHLAVVVPANSTLKIAGLGDLVQIGVQRIALASPAVPAGRYAREALEKAGLLAKLQARILDGENVRAALTYVALGEAEAGFVYRTDVAAAEKRVRLAFEVSADLHSPIRYVLGLVRHERPSAAAHALFEYLGSTKALDVFAEARFEVARRG